MCVYRTVSEGALNVLSSAPLADLLATERESEFRRRANAPEKSDARKQTLATWQGRWDDAESGRWTRRLIPNVTQWCARGFGKMNIHLT